MKGVAGFGISAKKVAPDLSNLGSILDRFVAVGCTTAELPIAEFNIVVGGRIRREPLELLLRICRDRPLRYTVHGPLAINLFVEPDRLPQHIQVLTAALEATGELGALHYVMHTGYVPTTRIGDAEAAYDRQREHLARLGDLARRLDVVICVENVFPGFDGDQYTASPSRLAAEIAAINHPFVAATLDVSHARLHAAATGGDYLAEIVELAPFARHLHLHDSFGRPDDIWAPSAGEKLAMGIGDLHLPLGWGDIPWDEVFARCEFPAGVILNGEPHDRYWSALADVASRLRALARQVRLRAE